MYVLADMYICLCLLLGVVTAYWIYGHSNPNDKCKTNISFKSWADYNLASLVSLYWPSDALQSFIRIFWDYCIFQISHSFTRSSLFLSYNYSFLNRPQWRISPMWVRLNSEPLSSSEKVIHLAFTEGRRFHLDIHMSIWGFLRPL